MIEFCSADPRLLATCYVPLCSIADAAAMTDEAIEMGAAALLIASGCPPGHSPSHIGLDGVWARAQEARIPVVFHVGGTGDLIDTSYFRNGLPIPPDFHGGEENFRSVDYMGIPGPPMQTLATLIFDGVLERFPSLRFGVIEQGAIWLPSWTRQMEAAFDAFARHEERLRALSMRPTDYVRRQVRATPYPTEDVGWIIEQSGPEVCLFSSDYPHVEGGRRPIERFEGSLAHTGEDAKQRFYSRQLRRPDGERYRGTRCLSHSSADSASRRIEMWPSSGDRRSSADRASTARATRCARSARCGHEPPWTNSTGASIEPGSKPHGDTYAMSSSMSPPGPPATAGPTTVPSQAHSADRAARSAGVNSGSYSTPEVS